MKQIAHMHLIFGMSPHERGRDFRFHLQKKHTKDSNDLISITNCKKLLFQSAWLGALLQCLSFWSGVGNIPSPHNWMRPTTVHVKKEPKTHWRMLEMKRKKPCCSFEKRNRKEKEKSEKTLTVFLFQFEFERRFSFCFSFLFCVRVFVWWLIVFPDLQESSHGNTPEPCTWLFHCPWTCGGCVWRAF